jgi:F-type H+-transporting ATPase subunit delta
MQLAVAMHYAKALAELVTRTGSPVSPADAVAQLRAFEQLVRGSHELRGVLLSPAVTGARKRQLAARLGAKLGVSPLILNFLYVIINRRRIGMLSGIRQAVEAQIDEVMGIVSADVRSARQLGAAERAKLEREIAALTGRQVRVEYSVEEALIGGVTARIGSTVYDGSVRGKLEAIGRRLAAQ